MLPPVLMASAAAAAPAQWDACSFLEREMAGRMTPFLSGRRGAMYFAGQSLAGGEESPVWPVRENETLGITHAFFRDGRARGEAIVCDEVSGCGHSLWGWSFYRETRVLYGSVAITTAAAAGDGATETVYENPSPISVKWRPDRITATYDLAGVKIEEVKFFTPTDVFLSVISLVGGAEVDAGKVELRFAGQSYVNPKSLPPASREPSSAGLPDGTPRSQQRNSTSSLDCDGRCVQLLERGTGYAKPIDCKFKPLPEGVDCLAKVGPMMYDNMTVVIAASQDIAGSLKLATDNERRQLYNFSMILKAGAPAVVGWAMGDDASETRSRVMEVMSVDKALAAGQAQTADANTFMTTQVPQLNITLLRSRDDGNGADTEQEAGEFDVHPGTVCRGAKYKFIGQVPTLALCEGNCSADPVCVEFEYASSAAPKAWCALYNSTSMPMKNPKFTCGCRGSCPAAPAPPGPPGPRPPPPPPRGVMDAYYYGWSQYWALLLDAQRPPFETVAHVQSAPNNFLGLHLHDTQFYLSTGAWIVPELHGQYVHGNLLMWRHALESRMLQQSSYWAAELARGILPDNMGAGWVASSTCDQLPNLVEGAWEIYSKDGNATYLGLAYDLFKTVFQAAAVGGNISATKMGGVGKQVTALISLQKMAAALGNAGDAAAWGAALARNAPRFSRQWAEHAQKWGGSLNKTTGLVGAAVTDFASALAPEPWFQDAWAATQADKWLLNDEYGFYPPNASWGAPLLASPLNDTHPGPWLAHTTGTAEALDGLFRHHVADAGINLTLAHIGAMQRDFGYTVFPEAWDRDGGLWGDQWYLWGVPVGVLLPLERLVGVTYSKVDSTLTVCDNLPPGWASATVDVPLGAGGWASVTVERLDAGTKKRIVVSGNTLQNLQLQPWLEGKQLSDASPAGYTANTPRGHVSWSFRGAAAAAMTVTVDFA